MRRASVRDNRRVRALAPIAALRDFALPPRCPACDAIVDADHRFCAACWGTLRFLDRNDGEGASAYAAVAYGDVARTVALRLKYGGRGALAVTMARLMRRVAPAADLLVPVPLHRWRLWSRGFNQAALIADALARETGVRVDRLVLTRAVATPFLRGLGRAERARAVRHAFAIDPARAPVIVGQRVLLIDDVHTSGATSEACAACLRRAGAASVAALCWARVLDEDAGQAWND